MRISISFIWDQYCQLNVTDTNANEKRIRDTRRREIPKCNHILISDPSRGQNRENGQERIEGGKIDGV